MEMTRNVLIGKVISKLSNRTRYSKFTLLNYLNTISTINSGSANDPYEVKLPFFGNVFDTKRKNNVAFTDYKGNNFSYSQLGNKSLHLANELKLFSGEEEIRVAFLCPQDSSFLITLWATWMSKNVAVPLTAKHPDNMLEYFIKQSEAKLVVTTKENADKINRITKVVNSKLHIVDFDSISNTNDEISAKDYNYGANDNALILFTSGTTGLPKGVLLTHQNIQAQVQNMCQAWEFTSNDTMLHVLPLHHTHGLIHALLCPLAVGARCHMMDKFDAPRVWSELLSDKSTRPSLLMGVPTVYVKLIEEFQKTYAKTSDKTEFVKSVCRDKMRLMLSGSASLPVPVIEQWEKITSHRILERYGMTELGVVLSNSLRGKRNPGYVGLPFQSVQARVVDLNSEDEFMYTIFGEWKGNDMVGEKKDQVVGELLVKGPSVFKEYYGNPEATRKDFTHDGWFITGDTVEFANGTFKILGRNSVDIIKSGGYKLSALEIETQLLGLKEIREVSVMAVSDLTWGQKVAAMIVWEGKELSLNELRDLAKTKLPSYACPTVIKTTDELPRNHLGKVNKKELSKLF